MANNVTEHKHGGLKQLPATAICGNDITSSCLYVSALAIIYSGRWAPVALLFVAGVLFLFRSIYAEVVGALPLNGGAYNALLNTTSKFRASVAACLTILSYMATAVISASEAMHYVHTLLHTLPIVYATIGLLSVFMILSIIGITESARVAVIIFIFHLASLTFLMIMGLFYLATQGIGLDILITNMQTPTPGGLRTALFFGFAASLLGISGFESSANFVEEQAENVFPKTLRNMWVAVSIFNPGMAMLALALVPIAAVHNHEEALLAYMGQLAGGGWLSTFISVDAALVLSGAVLTSFVGVNGLVRRMTLDRCLPQFFLKTNRRGTTHRIIISFFILCVSILLITQGELKALAGVYTISFLAVMALFAFGNILLKIKRAGLPRPHPGYLFLSPLLLCLPV
ncbi:MAG: APC family permease [Desulfobacteraceae bacterium]|jgi:amino acid transporter|nr:APC family permease [Desulfobacteraceae bacterium]